MAVHTQTLRHRDKRLSPNVAAFWQLAEARFDRLLKAEPVLAS